MPNPPELIAMLSASQDPDAMVLRQMIEEGADLSKAHEPDFAFEAGNEPDARGIAGALDALGYEVSLYEPDEDNPNYQVVGKRTMVLDLAALNRITGQFEALARINDATYDGWGAEIVE